MNPFVRQILTIARRDFMAVVATPTFLLFLLAPLFMLSFSVLGGMGAASIVDKDPSSRRIVILATQDAMERTMAADASLRALDNAMNPAPPLLVTKATTDPAAQARALMADTTVDTRAVAYGPWHAPTVLTANVENYASRYLPVVMRTAEQMRIAPQIALPPAKPALVPFTQTDSTKDGRRLTALAGVFALFLLTLMLSGQAIGMMAEEKGNKVIEILAAAAPLEAVFLGKLVGLLAVALMFIGIWGGVLMLGGTAVISLLPSSFTAAAAFAPAVGWSTFILLCFAYFVTGFLLLSAVFLCVGAQASSIREIQMLSLPITIVQMAMFGLANAAAGAPGSGLARFAEIFPLSSAIAMTARAAHDAAIWPHVLAMLWQLIWLAIAIWIAARWFRIGVLKSRTSWAFWRKDEPVVDPA